uniref:Leishmanolysin-like peptidase n=1 Tax=Trichobilharzia regenti TaxID=157069 RepID=A0AA85IMI6_TRIRE|nr:unnamed protein product [Trichobilharzia regenti]
MKICILTTFFVVIIISVISHSRSERICKRPITKHLRHAVLSSTVSKRSYTETGLRFEVVYSQNVISWSRFHSFKMSVMDAATGFWEKSLSVKEPSGKNSLIKRNCLYDVGYVNAENDAVHCNRCLKEVTCGNYSIPAKYLTGCYEIHYGSEDVRIYEKGEGIQPNKFLLFVDRMSDEMCQDSTAAYTIVCELHEETERPIAAYINFCPQYLDEKEEFDEETVVTAVHELGHALGFSSELFPYFRDEYGNPRTKRHPKTIDRYFHTWAVLQVVDTLILPTVLHEARIHYNCPHLDGVDLENEGGEGTSGTHFEKRLVGNEVMSGSTSRSLRVSRLTLAFFKDTGWYDVDLNATKNWEYGKNLGCDFVMKSCYEYMERNRYGKSLKPYCNEIGVRRCTDIKTNGICYIVKHRNILPREFQYLTRDATYGEDPRYYSGKPGLYDYCPLYTEVDNFLGNPITASCEDEENNQRMTTG